ncbi:MAG: hypothetical protein H0W02_18860 [Ktedonobacteraceae bacterium]|nr:hypothetical protein [Ktedonobacteraceae bacterium]
MAHAIASRSGQLTYPSPYPVRTRRFHTARRFHVSERRARHISAWLLLYCLIQGELGLAWDIQWHFLVGRDRFWTPPHTLIYIAVGLGGLVTLGMVLLDTYRYRRGFPGVDDTSTVRVLRIFHAPLGFIVTGFGPLVALIAAPLDNYWHQWYGIDITLWAPFHLMGAIGGLLSLLGIAYVFASQAVCDRQAGSGTRRFLSLTVSEWGFLVVISSLLEITMAALTQFTPLALGPVNIVTYPLPLAFGGALCLVSVVRFTRKPGTATLTTILLSMHVVVTQILVPVITRMTVAHLGLTYRAGRVPALSVTALLLPLVFVVSALFIDALARLPERAGQTCIHRIVLMGVVIALAALALPPCIAWSLAQVSPLTRDISAVLEPTRLDMLVSLPVVLALAWLGAFYGTKVGSFWQKNAR